MNKPVIISYDCADFDPIDEWIFEDESDVDFWMNFTIGPDQSAGNNFQLHVVTPQNLKGKNSTKHAIVLNNYSWPALLEAVDEILEQCRGRSWDEMCFKLAERMAWEYEGMQPYQPHELH